MKWIGALLFIAMTTWLGFDQSERLNRRPKHIRQLINALQILEAEMLYSQLPLKDAFLFIARQIPRPTKDFFLSLANEMEKGNRDLLSFWDQEVNNFAKRSAIRSNEQDILCQFGRTLGQHDFTQQQKHIHLTSTYLDRELEEARDQQQKYGKMAKSLGFLIGIFIVILLI